jgi:uncharacterized cupredoxin-like copper-binding protein
MANAARISRTLLVGVAALAAAVPTAAQGPDWAHAPKVEVQLASFSYAPRSIHLRAGRPVLLHLVNTASGGHDFTAPAFFAAGQLRPQDRGLVEDGGIELSGKQVRDVYLVPKAGRYSLKCSHSFHKMFGMSGEIVVD